MMAKAARDTAIVGARLEGTWSAASGCVTAVAGVSAICVSLRINPVARFFLAADQHKKEPSWEAIHRRLSRDCLPKLAKIMSLYG
jgi:hypothetical protein